jgi:hypothetical protein
LLALLIGGNTIRVVLAIYFLIAAFWAPKMSRRVYRYAAGLEVAHENGWKLIVKVRAIPCVVDPPDP